jgi:hypothetical protein
MHYLLMDVRKDWFSNHQHHLPREQIRRHQQQQGTQQYLHKNQEQLL